MDQSQRPAVSRARPVFDRDVACLLIFVVQATAKGDGMVVPSRAVPVRVTIPDQRALICYSNGVERLVIETRFSGAGSNFAWVVPFPAKPQIEPATSGLFPTLQHICRPQIIHESTRIYIWVLLGVWLGYFLFYVRRTGQVTGCDLMICALVGGAIATVGTVWIVGGVAVLLLLLIAINFKRTRQGWLLPLSFVLLLAFVASSLLLPALGRGRTASQGQSTSERANSVSVLDRRLVGIFETATITSRDPKALQQWLRANGYALSTNADAAIQHYVAEGWVFVAAKVRRDETNFNTSTPNPLSFTFNTKKPVYPMRLTSIENRSLTVDLYVFGDARAAANNFDVELCARANFPAPRNDPYSYTDDYKLREQRDADSVPICHALLREYTAGSTVVTKLSARLAQSDMQDDVWLEWRAYDPKKSEIRSSQGAAIIAANWGASLFALVASALCAVYSSKPENQLPLLTIIAAGVLAFVIAAGVFEFTPKVQVKMLRERYSEMQSKHFELSEIATGRSRIAEARDDLNKVLNDPKHLNHHGLPFGDNTVAGGPIHEEDSPGNYVLLDNSTNFQFVTYDALGEEHVLETVPIDQTNQLH